MCKDCIKKYTQDEIRQAKVCKLCFDWCLDGKKKFDKYGYCQDCTNEDVTELTVKTVRNNDNPKDHIYYAIKDLMASVKH